ncbi:MAG: hypothetical protein A2932_01870 [Candidatus Spechtbacteria bacterium RIFCSPLOWO2_01_FULL_46_10]|uniref:Large ribosomal subunit protein bL25 n=1 Tax=Candidatus Spechtbacteria bacterium RIFCSPLOWO2_01_FULL_46_10 TaxID=1802163 RepID=A0A1G2HHR9_9BACT|nr:MAG: hypothetical protein A2932_01870 [Candidatus Spechtbacteria bacterium RIFCSPLOWO2_01_FULL_46_10]
MLHLKVKQRDKAQKAKKLMKEGKLPGVVYGPKTKPISVEIDYKNFVKLYATAGGTTLINLDDEGKEEDKKEENVVLIRETQRNPVTKNFIHVDFYQLPLDKPIEITVSIEGEGESPAAKTGGVLVHNLREVDIRALPKNLIRELIVDLTKLENIGDTVTIADLPKQEGVEILAENDMVVFTIEEPREEEPEEELIAVEGEQIEAIKTEGEEKREEAEEEAMAEKEE